MQNLDKLQILKEIIYNQLDVLIDSDYYHLDFPNYPNIGDSLIWAGELAYLSRLPFKCHYACSIAYFDESKIKNNDIILLQGGGNFGDLWRTLQDFRILIINKYHNNKIIIFPQTVYYTDSRLLKKDAEILDNHPDLTICVRDSVSLQLLQSVLKRVKLILLPDMAFCLDLSHSLNLRNFNTTKLLLKRKDKELLNQDYVSRIGYSEKLDISDWPTFEKQTDFTRFRLQNFLAKGLFKIPVIKQFINSKSGLNNDKKQLNRFIQQGIDFINNYDEIYTTRLHGFILAVLLDKKVYVFDNSYGKNKNFYNTWMNDFKNVSFLQ
jgi:exopolysaccharide biosynthesis predicted pyruvyltransferase EpsI